MFRQNNNPFDALNTPYRVMQQQHQKKPKMDFPSFGHKEPKSPNSPQAAFVDALQREKAIDAEAVPSGHVKLTRDGAEYGNQDKYPIKASMSDHQFIQHHIAALCDHWAQWRANYIEVNGIDAYEHFYMPLSYASRKNDNDDGSDADALSDDDDLYD